MKFNEQADSYLDTLYKSVGAITAQQQYNTLILALGYGDDTIGFSHDPTWEQKASTLEYDLLERQGLIKITYA